MLDAARLGTGGDRFANQLHDELQREKSSLLNRINEELLKVRTTIDTGKGRYLSLSATIKYAYVVGAFLYVPTVWLLNIIHLWPGAISQEDILAGVAWFVISAVSSLDVLYPGLSPLPFGAALAFIVLAIVSFSVAAKILRFQFEKMTGEVKQQGARLADVKARLGA